MSLSGLLNKLLKIKLSGYFVAEGTISEQNIVTKNSKFFCKVGEKEFEISDQVPVRITKVVDQTFKFEGTSLHIGRVIVVEKLNLSSLSGFFNQFEEFDNLQLFPRALSQI